MAHHAAPAPEPDQGSVDTSRSRDLRVLGAIVLAATAAFALAYAQGTDWAAATERLWHQSTALITPMPGERLQAELDQLAAQGVVWLGGLLIAPIPAAVIAAASVGRRGPGLLGLIMAVSTALLLGFALGIGATYPQRLPAAEVPYGWMFALTLVTVGIGTWVGAVLRPRQRSSPR